MAIASQLYHVFVEPFPQGFDNIRACVTGKRVEQVFGQAVANAPPPREIDLSLFQRISSLVIGLILLIPIINAVVFAILEAINSSFVFQRLKNQPAPPIPPPLYLPQFPAAPVVQANEGIVPNIQELREPPATPEEYQQRKNQALAQLPHYPAQDHLNFERSQGVAQYNLDAVLATFNGNHNPAGRFPELFDYCGLTPAKREELRNCFEIYNHWNLTDQKRMIKTLLSKLFDFFQTNRNLFREGTEEATLFKADLCGSFDKIIDAHTNCEDQVLSQMESIIAETIADFQSIRGEGIRTLRGRILNRAAFTLFKYRSDLIRQVCAVEYPEERHMADMERSVKQRLAAMMGIQGGVFDVGARYDVVHRLEEKIANIVNILLFGEASPERIMEEAAQGILDDRKTVRRRESKYSPEEYLLNALRTYHGAAKTLRNDMLIWARQYFNLEAEDPLTNNFIRAISEDPDGLNASEGGNLTNQATLFFLETLGILVNNNLAQLAVI